MNGIVLMLLSDVAFALMAAATKFTGQRVPAAEIVFVRSVLSTAALFWYLRKTGVTLRPKEPLLVWTRGIVGYIALQSYFWALPQLTLGTAVMLNYTAPIFAVIFSFFILHEKPPLPVKLLLAVSFGGVYLLCTPEIPDKPAALMAGLLSGLLAGSVHVMIRHSRKSDPALLMIFYFTVSSMIGSGLLLFKTGWTAPTGVEWAGLLAITVISLVGQVCMTVALQKAPVWVVSPFGYLTPVMSLWLGWLLWSEAPRAANVLGSAVVIGCGVLMLTYFRNLRSGTAR
jgi:drug/metabolite transporter (DMT)-like permease